MERRVFIKVVGFTDVERHALNTVFRLSEERPTGYALWVPEAPEPPGLVLLDAQAYESRFEAESPTRDDVKIVWVGDRPPANAWRTFQRPLAWTDLLQAFDELFDPPAIDFDLEFDNGPDTQPSVLEPAGRKALAASADRDLRLYLRARLALHGFPFMDEAQTAAEALERLAAGGYELVVFDDALAGAGGLEVTRSLAARAPVLLLKANASWGDRRRAKAAGARAVLGAWPEPAKLEQFLQEMQASTGSPRSPR